MGGGKRLIKDEGLEHAIGGRESNWHIKAGVNYEF